MEVNKIKIPTEKGNISAVINKSSSKTDQLAILCPGFLDSKDYNHLEKLAVLLSENGYTTVRFDPIGTWESDGNISEYTNSQCLKDIENVFEYMNKENEYKKILLGGHSRGGQLSILYAARDSRITTVLGIMPSSGPIRDGQWRREWEDRGLLVAKRDLPANVEKYIEFQLPFAHVIDGDKYSALVDIKNVKVPIILIAGELDEMILPENVKKLYDNANDPKKFVNISEIGHNYRHNDKEIKIINNEILKLIIS
ncbi:MAG: alpha/beta fold hydrolase [Patescibacteria group bacterium]|jgi:pimeloyl-ACP methyl ester carboxylesterase|nr:alpha/beta fold hydrolase [Patescibacteria group bacterium]